MAKKFDIKQKYSFTDILNANSNAEAAGVFTVQNIAIEQIVPSDANKYGIRDIDKLAASIEEIGLQHNLVVKAKNEHGCYEIISGERRWRACRQLFENGNKNFEYLPCKIESSGSGLLNELRLIHANAMARELTDAEKMYQANRIKELIFSLKQQGYEFKGRTREISAEILGVSVTQMGIYEKTEKDLSDGLKEEFNVGNIGITAAHALAKLPGDVQADALRELKESGSVDVKAHKRAQPPVSKQRWRADDSEDFYYVTADGKVVKTFDFYNPIENAMFEFGNYFKSAEAAEPFAAKWQEVFAGNL